MNELELLQRNPKTTKLVTTWALHQIRSSISEDLTEEVHIYFEQIGLPPERLAEFMSLNTHFLFDFFDKQEFFIEITKNSDEFKFIVNGIVGIDKFKSRKEAEALAIQTAFEMLENKLNQDEENN